MERVRRRRRRRCGAARRRRRWRARRGEESRGGSPRGGGARLCQGERWLLRVEDVGRRRVESRGDGPRGGSARRLGNLRPRRRGGSAGPARSAWSGEGTAARMAVSRRENSSGSAVKEKLGQLKKFTAAHFRAKFFLLHRLIRCRDEVITGEFPLRIQS